MNRQELIRKAAKAAGVKQADAEAVILAAIDTTRAALVKGDRVTLVNFGTFKPKTRPAHGGFNVIDQQPHMIPDRKTIVFDLSLSLKQELNPGQHFPDPDRNKPNKPKKRKKKQPGTITP